ncbi:RHS repeat-associated core domain-containing protein [Microbacterium rhizomatis]|uniref:RHS repeat-associated core domain-containing protein n=1 Tax=Microbacterium rhizomatis TaxID=1631477 RepID=A0A5J5J099_9MICO|nr:RHS repeat-associated core domain-containing protein [Microbacterium rhizomatis]KAA9105621.1 RHS repeat-associated core domain-containing protein [Microbacterium rhizomatis]
MSSGVVSANAADGDGESGSAEPVVGGFGLGDGVEGLIDERVGSFSFGVPVADLGLRWDSRAVGANRVGFGSGWVVAGLGAVGVTGGVKVYPASGGVYDADASTPSGMSGYVLGDTVFSQTGGMLAGRADGAVGDREYGFTLSQTGGMRTYFSAAGDPLTQAGAFGNRTDWVWATDGSHRLERTVDAVGVVTGVDWSDPAAVRVTRTTGAGAVSSVVELDGGRVAAVVDSVGGRITVSYHPSGLISRITGVSGAVTEVSWQTLADGSAAVDRVRVIDGLTGAELSSREWDAASGVASGWPVYAGEKDVFDSGDSGFRYQTVLSDGPTRVTSEYNSTHLLIDRSVEVTTSNGPVTLQKQGYRYPGTDGDKVPLPWDLPEQFNRPTTTDVTFRDAAGRERTTSEQYEFDTFGRPTSQISADGAVTETTYDDTIPAGAVLPIGLPLSKTVTTADGLVSQTRYELNDARTAAVVEETFTGKAGGELTRTAKTERTVDADGFVSAERAFAQGGTGEPVVTMHARDIDMGTGTVTSTDTVAAGTDLAVTTSRVTDLLAGQPVEATDALGNTATAQYDTAGRVTAQTDATENTIRTAYRTVQTDGINATVTTTPDGVATTTETDVLGRVVKITDNLKDGEPVDGYVRVVESRAYPAPGTVEVTDAWGAVTVTKQDVFGREVETVAATGLTKITRYDDIARTVTTGLTPTGKMADAEFTSTSVMDVAGQTTEVSGTRADALPVPTIASVFDGFGRETATTDGTKATTTARDVFGNPISTTVAPEVGGGVPVVAERRFDEFGTSVEKVLTDGDQSRSGGTRTLDILGQTVSETDQNGLVSTYQYTPDMRVEKAATGYGAVTVNRYDAVTRELLETVTTSPIGVEVRSGFEYDPVTGNLLAVFDPADRAGTQVSYTYDAFGNTTSTTYPDGKRITHTYDGNGRRMTTTDIAGNTTSYAYDKAGLMTSAVQTDADGAEVSRVGYAYDPYARVTELSRANGVITRYAFTSAGQIATETTTGPDGSVQDAREYIYDTRGNLTHRTDTTSPADDTATSTSTTVYAYDVQDRLTRSTVHQGESEDGALLSDTTYVLTVSGDVSRETITVPDPDSGVNVTTVREFAYSPTGAIAALTTTAPDGTVTTVTPTYDAAGNLTTAVDGTRYTYDAVNRPVTETAPAGDTLLTAYWATGQRASLTTSDPAGSGEAAFYWDGTTLINDTHAQGDSPSGIASYLIAATRHSRSTSGPQIGTETTYYTQDRHGNISTLTAADGAPTTRYTYSDYGTPTTTTGAGAEVDARSGATAGWVGSLSYQPFQYSAEYAAPTGSQHLRARTYDPATMRFITQDTAQLHNTYNYADLNPIMMSDPTGRTPEWDAVVNGVIAWQGLFLAAISAVAAISTIATGGLGALGWGGAVSLVGGLGADLYSVAIATGRVISDLAPDFVDENAAAFFTSDAAAWSETALGLGAGAAGLLTAKMLRGVDDLDTMLAQMPTEYREGMSAKLKANPTWRAWYSEDVASAQTNEFALRTISMNNALDRGVYENVQGAQTVTLAGDDATRMRTAGLLFTEAENRSNNITVATKYFGVDMNGDADLAVKTLNLHEKAINKFAASGKEYTQFIYEMLQGLQLKMANVTPSNTLKPNVPWTLFKTSQGEIIGNNQATVRGKMAYQY